MPELLVVAERPVSTPALYSSTCPPGIGTPDVVCTLTATVKGCPSTLVLGTVRFVTVAKDCECAAGQRNPTAIKREGISNPVEISLRRRVLTTVQHSRLPKTFPMFCRARKLTSDCRACSSYPQKRGKDIYILRARANCSPRISSTSANLSIPLSRWMNTHSRIVFTNTVPNWR
jgi:hypothetical protein